MSFDTSFICRLLITSFSRLRLLNRERGFWGQLLVSYSFAIVNAFAFFSGGAFDVIDYLLLDVLLSFGYAFLHFWWWHCFCTTRSFHNRDSFMSCFSFDKPFTFQQLPYNRTPTLYTYLSTPYKWSAVQTQPPVQPQPYNQPYTTQSMRLLITNHNGKLYRESIRPFKRIFYSLTFDIFYYKVIRPFHRRWTITRITFILLQLGECYAAFLRLSAPDRCIFCKENVYLFHCEYTFVATRNFSFISFQRRMPFSISFYRPLLPSKLLVSYLLQLIPWFLLPMLASFRRRFFWTASKARVQASFSAWRYLLTASPFASRNFSTLTASFYHPFANIYPRKVFFSRGNLLTRKLLPDFINSGFCLRLQRRGVRFPVSFKFNF